MRSNVEKRHENWFNEAVGLAESVGTSPDKPRTAGRQTNRENVPADSVSQYYCRCLLIPFFDHLLSQIQTLPLTLTDVLLFADEVYFPNIHTAFQIFATVLVTTCTCERSISSLRRLKTYLRNSMSESRLKGLALFNIHRAIAVDINEVIDRFAFKYPRRMALVDILHISD